MMVTIMKNQRFSISKSVMMIFYILLDIYQKESVLKKEIDEYKDEVVLKKLSDTIDNMQFLSLDTFEVNNELFLDMAENYRKQELYTSYLEPIAVIAEVFSNSLMPESDLESMVVISRMMGYDQEDIFEYLEKVLKT